MRELKSRMSERSASAESHLLIRFFAQIPQFCMLFQLYFLGKLFSVYFTGPIGRSGGKLPLVSGIKELNRLTNKIQAVVWFFWFFFSEVESRKNEKSVR